MPAVREVPVCPSGLRPGDHVGQYEILEWIGSGGSGCIYKVRQDEGIFAVKILSECFIDDGRGGEEGKEGKEGKEALARADREFVALSIVDHPNILHRLASGRWPGTKRGWPYIVTEYVDGPDIYRWRAETQPSLRKICMVLAKVADALGHVHEAGLVHRDLKAPNILVRRKDDEPVLIDLGIARHSMLRPVTVCAEVAGTRTHYAPEYVAHISSPARMFGGPFEWTPKVDLYAFGFLAYELLSGRPPVGACENEDALWAAIMKDPVPNARTVNEAIPKALDALVMRLLEKEPAARPEIALEVRETLEQMSKIVGPQWEEAFPVPAVPPPPRREAPEGASWVSGFIAKELEKQEASEKPREDEARAAGEDERGPVEDGEDEEVGPPAVELEEKGEFEAGACSAEDGRAAKDGNIRREVERLVDVARPRLGRSRLLLVGGGVVACGLLAAVLARTSGTKGAKDDLLARYEREERALRGGGGGTGSGASAASGPARSARSAGRLAAPDAPGPTWSDAKQIDAEIRSRYGRPTIPVGGIPEGHAVLASGGGGGTDGGGGDDGGPVSGGTGARPPAREAAAVPKPPAEKGPKVVAAVLTEDPLIHAELVGARAPGGPADGPRKLGIPVGTHIRARLLSNLDSRTIAAGPVEAVLHLPFMRDGEIVLPARTMLYGRASESGGRFNVTFNQMRLPDDSEIAFEGLAMDRRDKKPGLAASARIESSGGSGEESLGAKVARGTGNILLNTVTGGVAEDVARGAGSAAVNHRASNLASGSSGSAILLDAGVLIDVFVTKTF